MSTTKARIWLCLLLVGLFTVGCGTAPAEVRAGEWSASSDFAKISFNVDPTGTKLTGGVIEYKCSNGAVTFSETISLDMSDKGWPIKNNKFLFDVPDAGFKWTGKFNSSNTAVSGTLETRSCSGKWKASR